MGCPVNHVPAVLTRNSSTDKRRPNKHDDLVFIFVEIARTRRPPVPRYPRQARGASHVALAIVLCSAWLNTTREAAVVA
ncbi:hypothetical protein J7T55_010072 [Diaporthe amygdali]|uniref:uncharacterized protein n=1 Tax=Phomopsis amygdali TaxID=1214568 RepID=UPI0022FF3E1D|nr:uncharacterized protein J7T55_010072 [Diaporthe amygdali]KAJ0113828.1 hypothetical protein J7T55_010072 [Diaporthe amygdali]